MLGARLRRRSDRAIFRVTGMDGGQWVLSPEDFGPAIAASPLECSELFTVLADFGTPEQPKPQRRVFGRSDGEQAGYEALAAAHAEALDSPREPAPLAPEEAFAAADLTAAEIANDRRLAWAFTSGRLAVSARLAGEVDKLLKAG